VSTLYTTFRLEDLPLKGVWLKDRFYVMSRSLTSGNVVWVSGKSASERVWLRDRFCVMYKCFVSGNVVHRLFFYQNENFIQII
jgi:hypothetical protein